MIGKRGLGSFYFLVLYLCDWLSKVDAFKILQMFNLLDVVQRDNFFYCNKAREIKWRL